SSISNETLTIESVNPLLNSNETSNIFSEYIAAILLANYDYSVMEIHK
ncbi:9642_t:CDS:2, partial [Scutellospora calospora]